MSGALPIVLGDLGFRAGNRWVVDGLSARIATGGITALIGPNGAGKTTLFRMITGQEKPDSGELKIGETVSVSYVDQSRESLDANKTVFQEITGGGEGIV